MTPWPKTCVENWRKVMSDRATLPWALRWPRAGYIDDLFPPGYSDAQQDGVASHMDRLVAMAADGVKVPLEPGCWRRFGTYTVHRCLRRFDVKRKSKLPIYVHAINDAMYQLGLPLAPHTFVHPPETISDGTLQRLIDSHAYVMSTLSVYDVQRFCLRRMNFPIRKDSSRFRLSKWKPCGIRRCSDAIWST